MKLVAICLVFISLSSCYKVETASPVETPVARATYFIDNGDYGSAILILEDVLKNETYKNNADVRLVLASAYAGRAGVKVENYWDYLIGFDAFAKNRKPESYPNLIPSNLIPDTTDQKTRDLLRLWNEQYGDLQKLQAKAEKIPLIDRDQRKGLMRARVLLADVDSGTAKLYRSLLSAVVVKSEFIEGEKILKSWSNDSYDLCLPAVNEISVWLSSALNLISEGLDDLGRAYPDQNPEYQSVRKDLEKGMKLSRSLSKDRNEVDAVCELKE